MLRAFLPAILLASVAPSQQTTPALVAHRGASYDAPENTLASTKLALERGADAVEIDLRMAGDGTLVVIHDSTTARTSDRDVRIADASWADLKDLDVGRWKAAEYAGERIPRFEQVLEMLPAGKQIFVDVKAGPEIAEPLGDAIAQAVEKKLVTHDQVVVIAFDADLIAALEQRRPDTKTQWLSSFRKDDSGRWSPTVDQVVATAKRIGSDGVDLHANLAVLDESFVAAIRKAGLELHTWTVNDTVSAQRLAALGFDSITTDRPAYLREGLARAPLKDACLLRHDFEQWNHTVPGVFGKALDLAKHREPVTADLRLPGSGTFATWVRARSWRNYETIFDTSANANEWECWIDAQAVLHARHSRSGAVVRHRFHQSADLDAWHHIALTWSPEGLKLHVSGRLVDEAATRGEVPQPGDRFHLGGGHPGNTRATLAFDEAALFSRPLDTDELEALYRRGLRALLGPAGDR